MRAKIGFWDVCDDMKRQYRTPIDLTRNLILLGLLAVVGCTVSVNGISFHNPFPTIINTKPVVVPDKKIVSHDFKCLIIEDVEARSSLPKSQLAMLTGKNLRDFLKANCVKDAQGNPQFRIVDKETDLTGVWAEMKPKAESGYPLLVLKNGEAYLSRLLPTDWAELQSDL